MGFFSFRVGVVIGYIRAATSFVSFVKTQPTWGDRIKVTFRVSKGGRVSFRELSTFDEHNLLVLSVVFRGSSVRHNTKNQRFVEKVLEGK